MISPKEKANEIIRDFREILDGDFPRKKEDTQYNFLAQCCAIKSVEHILKAREISEGSLILDKTYWEEVLSEITEL